MLFLPISSEFLTLEGSHHITGDGANLTSMHDYHKSIAISMGKDNTILTSHSSTALLHSPSQAFTLSKMLCSPEIKTNLIFVSNFYITNRISIEFFFSFISL